MNIEINKLIFCCSPDYSIQYPELLLYQVRGWSELLSWEGIDEIDPRIKSAQSGYRDDDYPKQKFQVHLYSFEKWLGKMLLA